MTEVTRTAEDQLSLTELVNRVLDKGAVISGDVVISVGGVDLIYLGLRLVVSSVESMREVTSAERLAQGPPRLPPRGEAGAGAGAGA
jgi:gas vesicle structural protein